MPRYKILIEYDGAPFSGWQYQDNSPSVQRTIMTAIEPFSGEKVMVQGAGRTDAGVHALGQVAHFDLSERARDRHHPRRAQRASAAASDGDPVGGKGARRISTRAARRCGGIISIASPTGGPISRIERGRAWRVPRRLDAEAMHAAAQRLVGKHDFTTFRSTECQAKSPEKTLDRLDVSRAGDEIHITAVARSFLHNQVRSMVGSLVPVGDGKWTADDLARALAARDRSACGPVAPPDGLYLVRVDY